MKKIFKLSHGYWNDYWLDPQNADGRVCSYELHKYFNFPKGTSQIEIVLSDEPDPDSYLIEMNGFWHIEFVDTYRKRQEEIVTSLGRTILPYFKKHPQLYVTLFYIE